MVYYYRQNLSCGPINFACYYLRYQVKPKHYRSCLPFTKIQGFTVIELTESLLNLFKIAERNWARDFSLSKSLKSIVNVTDSSYLADF